MADFGLSRVLGPSNAVTPTVVTLWYRAPELLLQSGYSSAVDVYSLGCILAELHLKRPLLAADSEVSQLQRYFEVCGLPNASYWPPSSPFDLEAFRSHLRRSSSSRIASTSHSAANRLSLLRRHVPGLCESGVALLSACLEFRPAKRILARTALHHAYFAEESPAAGDQPSTSHASVASTSAPDFPESGDSDSTVNRGRS